jgi:hypothetical protein
MSYIVKHKCRVIMVVENWTSKSSWIRGASSLIPSQDDDPVSYFYTVLYVVVHSVTVQILINDSCFAGRIVHNMWKLVGHCNCRWRLIWIRLNHLESELAHESQNDDPVSYFYTEVLYVVVHSVTVHILINDSCFAGRIDNNMWKLVGQCNWWWRLIWIQTLCFVGLDRRIINFLF